MNKKSVFTIFSFEHSEQWKKELDLLLDKSEYVINKSEREDKSMYSDETIWNHLVVNNGAHSYFTNWSISAIEKSGWWIWTKCNSISYNHSYFN